MGDSIWSSFQKLRKGKGSVGHMSMEPPKGRSRASAKPAKKARKKKTLKDKSRGARDPYAFD